LAGARGLATANGECITVGRVGSCVTDISAYLDQRLLSIAEEGLKGAKVAVTKITSMAAGNNQLGNSRLWFRYDEAIQREYENALNKAAGLVSEIVGSAAQQYAG
jgi:hypothetical protein